MIVLGLEVGMVLTFSLKKRPGTPHPLPQELPRATCWLLWELGWVGVCRELTDSASALTCVGRTWQDWQGALAPDTEVGFVPSSRAPGSSSPAGMGGGG